MICGLVKYPSIAIQSRKQKLNEISTNNVLDIILFPFEKQTRNKRIEFLTADCDREMNHNR